MTTRLAAYKHRLQARAHEKQARQQLEHRWQTAFESSGIGITMAHFGGLFFAANRAFQNMLGYTESEICQRSFLDITYEEDREVNQELITELVEGKRKYFQMEKRYRRKDGSLLWARVNAALVPGIGAIAPFWFQVVEDITERKLSEAKLRASERSLRDLTETIPQMLWSADASGAVAYCNQRMLEYTGLPAEEVRGVGWMRVVHPDDVEALAQAWATAVSAGQPFQHEFRCLRAADHAYRWCISSASPFRGQNGEVIKWFGSVVDLHEWKGAQHALQMALVELSRVSRLTTMGELAASIAHEVNQPLTAVINNSNACLRLLAEHTLGPDVLRRTLEAIVADANRASAVIARIRGLMRKTPAEKTELDINELIQEVLALTVRDLEHNGVFLERRLANALPLVLGDRVQLQQVLLNLVMNSIDAMAAVTTRARVLWVESRLDDSGNIVVAVGDTGTGLDVEADRIFTPLFTTKPNGMGMGLSISRSFVEGHGGRLWTEPNSPNGAVFCFTLPAAAGSGHG